LIKTRTLGKITNQTTLSSRMQGRLYLVDENQPMSGKRKSKQVRDGALSRPLVKARVVLSCH